MLRTIFNSVDRVIIGVLVATVLVMMYSNSAIKSELQAERDTIKQVRANFEQKQLEITYLKSSLDFADKQNQRLIKERDLLSSLQKQHEDKLSAIQTKLTQTQTEIAKLRQSDDHNTQDWAIACVPAAVVSMYQYATAGTCHKHSDKDAVRVRDDAKQVHSTMPGATVFNYRQQQPLPIRGIARVSYHSL